MATVTQIGPRLGIASTCAALGLPRATYYRRRRPSRAASSRRPSPRALSAGERAAVLTLLHEPRFVDHAPAEIYATLLDAGQYLCSERTMYRLLAAHGEGAGAARSAPPSRLCRPGAAGPPPNELWSWDITKLLGPAKWTYFYLYVMLDVFSRYVVGWMVSQGETATLAEQFIRETCARHGIGREQLTIHADRGQAMVSKSVAFLLADLGGTKTHARPHVSKRQTVFGSTVQDAQVPTGVPGPVRLAPRRPGSRARLLPLVRHRASPQRPRAAHPPRRPLRLGRAAGGELAAVLTTAYAAHPERFPAGRPTPAPAPTEVWINPPKPRALEEVALTH